VATVYQKCKSDKRNANYPCSKPRCGHPWTVRYREGTGRGAPERQPSFELKSQAEAFAARVERDKYEGLFLDPKRGQILLRDYADEWLGRQVIAESTRRNYDSFLRIHLNPALGDKTLAAIRRKDIEAFIAALTGRLAPSTLCDRMTMVTSLFLTAIQDKRIIENPTEGVKLPRDSGQAIDADRIPTLHEVDLIAKQISPQYRLTIYLQAAAGLRISEALAFSPDCHRDGFLRIRRQVSTKAHKDDCRTRFVPLKHRAEGDHPMPTANTYSYHFRKALKAASITRPDGKPKYTPHSLRHFFASTALAAGIPIHEVSHWLGHKSIKTTVDVYGHLIPASWDRCRTAMHNALRPDPPMS
jgi:integrase